MSRVCTVPLESSPKVIRDAFRCLKEFLGPQAQKISLHADDYFTDSGGDIVFVKSVPLKDVGRGKYYVKTNADLGGRVKPSSRHVRICFEGERR